LIGTLGYLSSVITKQAELLSDLSQQNVTLTQNFKTLELDLNTKLKLLEDKHLLTVSPPAVNIINNSPAGTIPYSFEFKIIISILLIVVFCITIYYLCSWAFLLKSVIAATNAKITSLLASTSSLIFGSKAVTGLQSYTIDVGNVSFKIIQDFSNVKAPTGSLWFKIQDQDTFLPIADMVSGYSSFLSRADVDTLVQAVTSTDLTENVLESFNNVPTTVITDTKIAEFLDMFKDSLF